ncbi:MAG: hypothetical protein ACOCXA_09095 [Planctomycetota bacterium]
MNDLPVPVAAYLRALPALRRDRLRALLLRARAICPQARLNLRLNMPTFDHHGR